MTQNGFRTILAHAEVAAASPPSEHWVNEPDVPVPAWAAWWDAAVKGMSDEARENIWAIIDRLRFYEVVEVPLRG